MICSCAVSAEPVVNQANYKSDRLTVARKIAQYMSKTFGTSKEDLPEALRQRFEKFSQSGDGEAVKLDWTQRFGFVCCAFSVGGPFSGLSLTPSRSLTRRSARQIRRLRLILSLWQGGPEARLRSSNFNFGVAKPWGMASH